MPKFKIPTRRACKQGRKTNWREGDPAAEKRRRGSGSGKWVQDDDLLSGEQAFTLWSVRNYLLYNNGLDEAGVDMPREEERARHFWYMFCVKSSAGRAVWCSVLHDWPRLSTGWNRVFVVEPSFPSRSSPEHQPLSTISSSPDPINLAKTLLC